MANSPPSPLPSNLSSVNSFPSEMFCFFFGTSGILFATYSFTYIVLLLSLCILILYHGYQNRKQKCTTSSAVSHFECITYQIVAMEMIGIFGCILIYSNFHVRNETFYTFGSRVFFFTWYGEVFFHILTCLERYLAVVHPITYLRLRNGRIRNISVGSVWLLSVTWTGLTTLNEMVSWDLYLIISAFFIISFCSLSVLHVLIHPGPGEQHKNKRRVDQSKKRAFVTIVSILGVLVLRLCSNLIPELLYIFRNNTDCTSMTFTFWLNLPSSLVLPLLFLHKKRKVLFEKKILQMSSNNNR